MNDNDQYLMDYIKKCFTDSPEIAKHLSSISEYNEALLCWDSLYSMPNAESALQAIGQFVHDETKKTGHKLELLISILILSRSTEVSSEAIAAFSLSKSITEIFWFLMWY